MVVLRSQPIGDMKLELSLSEKRDLKEHKTALKVFLDINLQVKYIKIPKLHSEISMQILLYQIELK